MIKRCRFLAGWILPGIFLTHFFTGCSTRLLWPASATKDHAYISYWPPPKSSKELRLAVKDLIDMKGQVTTAGSQYVANHNPPAAQDAACMAIARERGVRIVGKTNLTEFAVGTSGMNDYFGTPINPATKKHLIPGGSSSGSAVAVANGTADVAFGTDTAGSIRVPAACCGIYGLKTTYGLVSLKGVFPLSPEHLDTVGPMAKDIPHLVTGMELLERGFAGKYASAVAAKPSAGRIKIGRLYLDGTNPAIDRAIDDVLRRRGFRVVRLNEEFSKQWLEAKKNGNTVAVADAWRSDDQYRAKFGVSPITKASILLGKIAFDLSYQKALATKQDWQRTLQKTFRKVDLIALPTLQHLPLVMPYFGRTAILETRVLEGQNTVAVNFAGNPALAVPIPIDDPSIPWTSVQLVGPRRGEAQLLNAGRLIAKKP